MANDHTPQQHGGSHQTVGDIGIIGIHIKVSNFRLKMRKKHFIRVSTQPSGKEYDTSKIQTEEATGAEWSLDPPARVNHLSKSVSFQLLQHRFLCWSTLLASVEIPISDLVSDCGRAEKVYEKTIEGPTGLKLLVTFETYASIAREKDQPTRIEVEVCTNAGKQTVIPPVIQEQILTDTDTPPQREEAQPQPVLDTNTDNDLHSKMNELDNQVNAMGKFMEPADKVVGALGALSEVHEIARAAWIAVSGIYQVPVANTLYKNDKAILDLYNTMMDTYKIAIDNERDIINEGSHFAPIFDEIVRQSEECYVFLHQYVSKGRARRVGALWGEAPEKLKQFTHTFEKLKKQFYETQVDITTITVLKTQKVIENIERLRPLEPSGRLLGPKSHCLLGTRRSLLEKVFEWIFCGEESILWISGVAGSGKSSLMGTLHNSLARLGFRSRLAAFIRFDRNDYNDAGSFVRSLAFRLACFDQRFAKPIANAVERSRQMADVTDLETQAQSLIINPLRKLSKEVADEGKIVVLVDALDESTKSDRADTNFRQQLLQLFADNIFQPLPFLRIVIASRPEEDITLHLGNKPHVAHFTLEITSEENKKDIQYFFLKRLSSHPFHVLDEDAKKSAIQRLSERAAGLFIWASTAVNFIQDNVRPRLDAFMETELPKSALHALTTLYTTALNSLVREQGDEDIKQNIRIVLGLIMAGSKIPPASDPFPPFSSLILHELVQYVDAARCIDVLQGVAKLQSVLIEDNQEGLRLMHRSFDDFLTGSPDDPWYVNVEEYLEIMANATIRCVVDHVEKADEELQQACSSLSYEYASLYWPEYCIRVDLEHMGPKITDYEFLLQELVFNHLIRWMYTSRFVNTKNTDLYTRSWANSMMEKLKRLSEAPIIQKDQSMRQAWHDALDLIPASLVDSLRHILLRSARSSGSHEGAEEVIAYRVENIYVSVFVRMASGSQVYEEILDALEKTTAIPPIVPLGSELNFTTIIRCRKEVTLKDDDTI
ncbi:nacht wd40 domain-containing protein [Moniliophthora roreri MCA 2997]|uniref:Nacht wd40 domain-containing protein n=1 Tax=Moniliophthora roreri (strain MCA 2997) TaxID=1381753 RepID=V2X5C4_MONRO|nr:nacht wd40 domain-containing protein [Moniliophthora roreri MCA 2997]